MNYMPMVESVNRVGQVQIGDKYVALMFDNIKSLGSIEYTYLLGVFDTKTEQPVYFVASEVSSTAKAFGGGSHFLGVFDGEGHSNLGSSDDWADSESFFAKAIALVEARFASE
jgi:hypothetical protein